MHILNSKLKTSIESTTGIKTFPTELEQNWQKATEANSEYEKVSQRNEKITIGTNNWRDETFEDIDTNSSRNKPMCWPQQA